MPGLGQTQRQPQGHRYLIFVGNNSDVIRAAFQRRAWWRSALADEPRVEYYRHKLMCDEACAASAYELMWKPTLGIKLSTAAESTTVHALAPPPAGAHRGVPQALNHFPSVKPIASKNGLFRSLQVYYTRCGMDVYDNVPTTFLLQVRLSSCANACVAKRALPLLVPAAAQNIANGSAEWSRFTALLPRARGGAVRGGGRAPPSEALRREAFGS